MQSLKFSIKKCLTRSSGQNKYKYMDPAPTVFSYRMQRLWLTPFFRVLISIGLPIFCIFSLVSMFLQGLWRLSLQSWACFMIGVIARECIA